MITNLICSRSIYIAQNFKPMQVSCIAMHGQIMPINDIAIAGLLLWMNLEYVNL